MRIMFEGLFGKSKKGPSQEGSYKAEEQPETVDALERLIDAHPDDLGPNAGQAMDQMIDALDKQAEAKNEAAQAPSESDILDRVKNQVIPPTEAVPVQQESKPVSPYAAPEDLDVEKLEEMLKKADPVVGGSDQIDADQPLHNSKNKHGFKEVA